MRWIVLAVFAIYLGSLQAAELSAQEAFDTLELERGSEQIQGVFTQKKYFKVLSKPISSTGKFSASTTEFEWRTIEPVTSAIMYQDDKIWLEDHLGNKKEQPEVVAFVAIITAMLQADFVTLAERFTIHKSLAQCIALLPIDDSLAQVIASVEVCGKGKVNQLTLTDQNDNRTDIFLEYGVKVAK